MVSSITAEVFSALLRRTFLGPHARLTRLEVGSEQHERYRINSRSPDIRELLSPSSRIS